MLINGSIYGFHVLFLLVTTGRALWIGDGTRSHSGEETIIQAGGVSLLSPHSMPLVPISRSLCSLVMVSRKAWERYERHVSDGRTRDQPSYLGSLSSSLDCSASVPTERDLQSRRVTSPTGGKDMKFLPIEFPLPSSFLKDPYHRDPLFLGYGRSLRFPVLTSTAKGSLNELRDRRNGNVIPYHLHLKYKRNTNKKSIKNMIR